MGKTMKAGALVAGGAIAGIVGTSLVKGFSRLSGIESAEAKLRGLGHTAQGVDKIMENALASVKGTAFGLDDAATAAASAVAAGVKPGEDLERTLRLMGDAATIAGTDFGSMASIFNKVSASGMIQGDVLAQLGDAGIPILQMLGKEMGVSAQEVRKLASAGEIDFETFQKAMESGLGGAAQESGKTFSGAMANMQAALGRLGASVLGGAFAKMPDIFGKATSALDGLGPVAEKLGAGVGKAMARAGDAIRRIDWSPLVAFATSIRADLIPAVAEFGKMVGRNLLPLFEMLGPPILAIGSSIMESVVPALTTILEKAVQFEGVLIPLVAGLAAGALAFKAYATAVALVTAAKAAWVTVQTALNLALTANPIGLVIAAIAALAVGLTVAYKRSEKFRNIVNGALGAVSGAARAFGQAVAAIFKAVVAAVKRMQAGIAAAMAAITGVFKGVMGTLSAFGAAMAAAAAKAASLASSAKEAIGKLASAFKSGVTKAVGAVRTLPAQVLAIISGLASSLSTAGENLMDMLAGGIRKGVGKVTGAVKGVVGKVRGFLPGSPVKEGPLKSWNNGGAGKRLMGLLAKGIKHGGKGVAAAMDSSIKKVSKAAHVALKKMLKAAKKQVDSLKGKIDLFKSIRDQVKSAFSPDLFSGTLSNFLTGLSTGLAGNKAVQAVIPKLKKILGKDFFTALMSSGNVDLILGLAGADKGALQQVEKDWLEMNRVAGNIGKTTAKDNVGRGLAGMQSELKKLNKAVGKLDKAIGKEVGKSMKRGGRNGKNNRKKG